MNDRIPVTNNTGMPQYVGGQMIPPGETRHFALDQVPPNLRPVAPDVEAEAPPADPVADILAHSVKDIKELLPAMSDAELDVLGDAEQRADTPRTTLLGAIAEEQLKRAGDGE